MVYMENAGLIEDLDELKGIVNETYNNPTIDRLMFLETKSKPDREGQLFPCYIKAFEEVKGKTNVEADRTNFICVLIQSTGGEYGLVEVRIPDTDVNIKLRFWDKPPKKAVRDETPWVEAGVVDPNAPETEVVPNEQ